MNTDPNNEKQPGFDVKRVGQKLAHLRASQGLSLTALAERAQVAKSYIHSLERGEAENPGLKPLDALAQALGVTLFDLFDVFDQAPSAGGEALREATADADRLRSEAPAELRTFLDELEMREGPTPIDVLRSLSTIQLRGKRPQTVDDWRFTYESLKRAVR